MSLAHFTKNIMSSEDVLVPSNSAESVNFFQVKFGSLAVCGGLKIAAVVHNMEFNVAILSVLTLHILFTIRTRDERAIIPVLASMAFPTFSDHAEFLPYLYICDISHDVIVVLDVGLRRRIGTVVIRPRRRPEHIAVYDHVLAVSCWGKEACHAHVVQLYTGHGLDWVCAREIGNGYFCHPCGIAISSNGAQITVADSENHRLCHISVDVRNSDDPIILGDQSTGDALCEHIAWCEQGQGWLMQCCGGKLLFMGMNGQCTTIGKLARRNNMWSSGITDITGMGYVADVGLLVRAGHKLLLFPIDVDAIRMLGISHTRLAWMIAVVNGIRNVHVRKTARTTAHIHATRGSDMDAMAAPAGVWYT